VLRRNGFSLVEVVFAVGILAIVLLLLIGLMVTATTGSGSNHETVVGMALAESEIDRWKRESFTFLEDSLGSNLSMETADGRPHDIEMRIERMDTVAGSPDFDVLRLVATITWESRTIDPGTRKREGRVRLETQICGGARY